MLYTRTVFRGYQKSEDGQPLRLDSDERILTALPAGTDSTDGFWLVILKDDGGGNESKDETNA